MDSARQTKSNEELQAMIARASSQVVNGDYAISRDEFMGVMAEAEFYICFRKPSKGKHGLRIFESIPKGRTSHPCSLH
jgi:hypothetical protein